MAIWRAGGHRRGCSRVVRASRASDVFHIAAEGNSIPVLRLLTPSANCLRWACAGTAWKGKSVIDWAPWGNPFAAVDPPQRPSAPEPAFRVGISANCWDVAIPGGYTCAQQASWGRCWEGFLAYPVLVLLLAPTITLCCTIIGQTAAVSASLATHNACCNQRSQNPFPWRQWTAAWCMQIPTTPPPARCRGWEGPDWEDRGWEARTCDGQPAPPVQTRMQDPYIKPVSGVSSSPQSQPGRAGELPIPTVPR